MNFAGPFTTAPCTGADGSGATTYTSPRPLTGKVHAVYVKYAGDKPATTDVTIKTRGTSPACPSLTLLAIANGNTDGIFYPRVDSCKAADGTALTANNQTILIDDYIQIVVAQANTDDTVSVWFGME